MKDHPERLYAEIEELLAPLAEPLPRPRPGDWLTEHRETGQTFRQYLAAQPVCRSSTLNRIYLCLLGGFSAPQQRILELTQQYLALFFDVPVEVRRHVSLADIPARAKRSHADGEDEQLLTTHVLDEVLRPDRPADALAYLALTDADLWPGGDWNFVYGQAELRQRIGVWSLYRNGEPEEDAETYRLCLRRTLATAAHETGHLLTLHHCIAFHCLMNGGNNQQERDHRPLHLCPVCLRKLLWNLQVEPIPYLQRLAAFGRAQDLDDADWYGRAIARLPAAR